LRLEADLLDGPALIFARQREIVGSGIAEAQESA